MVVAPWHTVLSLVHSTDMRAQRWQGGSGWHGVRTCRSPALTGCTTSRSLIPTRLVFGRGSLSCRSLLFTSPSTCVGLEHRIGRRPGLPPTCRALTPTSRSVAAAGVATFSFPGPSRCRCRQGRPAVCGSLRLLGSIRPASSLGLRPVRAPPTATASQGCLEVKSPPLPGHCGRGSPLSCPANGHGGDPSRCFARGASLLARAAGVRSAGLHPPRCSAQFSVGWESATYSW